MKAVGVLVLLILALFGAAEAQACRIPSRPERLQSLEADAVVLVLITGVQVDGANWRATAVSRGSLSGHVRQREFSIDSGPTGEIVSSCDRSWLPKLDRYGVMYLRRTPDGFRLIRIYPYWWARMSGDRRLARLDRLLPLGAARAPTADEIRLLDLAEPRLELPAGIISVAGYTRIYARAAPGTVVGMLIPARRARRLIVDGTEELPTEASCRCRPIRVRAELGDLLAAGRLPPFNP